MAGAPVSFEVAPGIRIQLSSEIVLLGNVAAGSGGLRGPSVSTSPGASGAASTGVYAVLLRAALGQMAKIQREGFAAQFHDAGPGWAPNAPSTIARKQRLGLPPTGKRGRVLPRLYQGATGGGSTSILIMTGWLRDSYVQKGAPGHVEDLEVDGSGETGSVTSGSNVPYALTQQEGRPAGFRRGTGLSALVIMRPKKYQGVWDRAVAGAATRAKLTRKPPSSNGGAIPARALILRSVDVDAMETVVEDLVGEIESVSGA